LFFEIEDEAVKALFEGDGNSDRQKACGIHFEISFNQKYQNEYALLIGSDKKPTTLPIEYYEIAWRSFARDDRVTPRTIPIKSALIDSSSTRFQNGSDIYVSRIIKDLLTDAQIVSISQ